MTSGPPWRRTSALRAEFGGAKFGTVSGERMLRRGRRGTNGRHVDVAWVVCVCLGREHGRREDVSLVVVDQQLELGGRDSDSAVVVVCINGVICLAGC